MAFVSHNHNGVVYHASTLLEGVAHGFSTRLGGVSPAPWDSLNISLSRGDEPRRVRENYRRLCAALGTDEHCIAMTRQVHSDFIRPVGRKDALQDPLDPLDADADGLITNEPGVCLTIFYADCVPVLLYDPKGKVIAAVHSGWRGTVNKMGKVTVELMQKEYGTDPSQGVAAIGPSICRDCYEVSEDVIEEFRAGFDEALWPDLFCRKENGKYQLDLWRANQAVLAEAGVCKENTAVTNLCTHCNPEILFSHRSTGTARGNLSAFLALV